MVAQEKKEEQKPVPELVADDVVANLGRRDVGHLVLGEAYRNVLQLACEMRQEIERRGGAALYALVAPGKASKVIALCDEYEEAERLLKQHKGSTIHVVTPVGDERDRKGQQLAAGLAEEMTALRKDLARETENAAALADALTEEKSDHDRARDELKALRADIDAQVAERTATERAALVTARDVVLLNGLRSECATLREANRRLQMAIDDPNDAKKHLEIVSESRLASQLEAVVRVANGQPCPDEGAFNWSAAARAVDELWHKRHTLKERIKKAAAELVLPPGGANAALAARAAKAILDDALEEKPPK